MGPSDDEGARNRAILARVPDPRELTAAEEAARLEALDELEYDVTPRGMAIAHPEVFAERVRDARSALEAACARLVITDDVEFAEALGDLLLDTLVSIGAERRQSAASRGGKP